jgi:hypothetical protein
MAFDGARIFRVLYYLSEEPVSFILAQDAFLAIDQCMTQLRELPATIAGFKNITSCNAEETTDIVSLASYVHLVTQAEALQSKSDEVGKVLEELASRAVGFWFCCPADHSTSSSVEYNKRWVQHKDGVVIEPVYLALMVEFKAACLAAVHLLFSDLLVQVKGEEEEHERQLRSLSDGGASRLAHFQPVLCDYQTLRTQNSFVVSCVFPTTHYHVVSPSFASMLGFSIPKILSTPIADLTVNNMELDSVVKGLNSQNDPKTSVLIYRSSVRELITVNWEICSSPINGAFTAIGTNISNVIDISKQQQSGSIQRMLRQWLHSIRNASFEQQAVLLRDEIAVLRDSIRDSCDYHAAFESITTGLNTLIHTAKTSVGLIDQALETKGLIHLMSVGDFLNNISNFPINFSISEGIGSMPIKVNIYLEGEIVLPATVSDLFIRCDVVSIQAFVDNLISNAVR